MRLTLRTLLAFLDGILEPNDAQELNKKIEESEYATGLIHRIRDVMRRLRLGAPSLTDRDPGLDPNTVAEYLDNTLDSDRVTDFEKVCLDSDIHLAEVASSHQILTLVLGEPAEVAPDGRQRMYQLQNIQNGAKPPPTPSVAGTPAAPVTSAPPTLDLEEGGEPSAAKKFRTKPTVPEYLREPRKKSRWFSAAAAVLLAVCFTVVVLMLLGQFEPEAPLGEMLVGWGWIEASSEVAIDTGEDGRETKTPPVEPSGMETTEEPAVDPLKAPTQEPAVKPTTESGKPAAIEPIKDDTPPAVETPPEAATETLPTVPPTVPGTAPPDTAVEDPKTEPEKKPVAEPLPPEPLGRLMSVEQVLLSDDPEGGWVRVAANQMLIPRHVLVLPTYRAKVTLTVGATLEILGKTRIELLRSSPRELPGIRVLYGRVVLMPLAKAGTQLRVVFGDHSGTITFDDAESVAAIEVQRSYVPGTNPESEPPHINAHLYVTTGAITWEETGDGEDAQPLRLTPSQRLVFDAQLTSAPMTVKELPKWIEAEPISGLDRRASAAIAQGLPTDRPARVGLLELATARPQKEVKWLAQRCLSYVGQFRDMVTLLNDPDRKLDWTDYIDVLRESVARDSETAAAVRMALEKQYPQQAADLYRMLWGYTNEDLQAGEDAKLVRALDNDLLAVRVLSFGNLKNITGLGLYYQPEQTAPKRQQSTRRWRQRLEAKNIRLKSEKKAADGDAAPSPIPAAGT